MSSAESQTIRPRKQSILGFATSRTPPPGEVQRATGADGYPASEVLGGRESDVEDCEDGEPSDLQEARARKALTSPIQPTKAELDMHKLILIPFRAWCQDCVLAPRIILECHWNGNSGD